jgi:hypothetical protein
MRSLQWFALGFLLLSAGCIFKTTPTRPVDNTPKVMSKIPTEAELVSYLNKTESPQQKIVAFTSDSLYIETTAQGSRIPTIRGDLICEKPKNFRLRGRALGMDQIDFGSNPERFWFWIKESPDPHIFHCSYEDFEKGTPLPFPFQPEWVLQVLGMGDYGDAANYKVTEKAQTFELSEETTLQGKPVKKIIVFSKFIAEVPKSQILEHRIVDGQGKVISSARIEKVARDSKTGIIYPEKVTLEWPAEQIKMRLELDRVKLNQPSNSADIARFYTLPNWSGTRQVDLGRINTRYQPNSRIQPVGGTQSKNRN